MQTSCLPNIRRLLALGPVHITVRRIPYPPHWRSGQELLGPQHSLGAQIKRQRLDLHLFQATIAKKLGVTTVSLSNWERGVRQPSRRIQRKILDFFQQSQSPSELQDSKASPRVFVSASRLG